MSWRRLAREDAPVSSGGVPGVSALTINVTIPEELRRADTRGTEFTLTTLNIRLLPDGHLTAKACGRPTAAAVHTSRSRARHAREGGPAAEAASHVSALRAARHGPVLKIRLL